MIELFQFPPAFNLPSPSPFCLKLELLLKMARIPYSNRYDADVTKAPKAKLPYIVVDGRQTIGDSELVLQYLKESGQFKEDDWLSKPQQAQRIAVTRLAEDHLYWLLVESRWLNDESWPLLKAVFFAGLPPLVRSVVPGIVRNQVRKTLRAQGLGRHGREELELFARQDLEALAATLGDRPYMMGERLSSADGAVFGLLSSIYYPDLATPLKAAALEHPSLAAYCDRIMAQFFPNYSRGRGSPAAAR
jgi:glutathione S-transferase